MYGDAPPQREYRMQLKMLCSYCLGTGKDIRISDPPVEYVCNHCDGVGYHTFDIIGDELSDIIDKIQEVKTKVNTVEADINYIKARVDQIWDKVK